MAEDEMTGWHHVSMDMSLSKLWEIVKNREACHAAVHGKFEPRWGFRRETRGSDLRRLLIRYTFAFRQVSKV